MTGQTPADLTSWKEIAQRLQVSVRTAQLWEKERGLPVRRVPGKRGRVYLRESELEAWLAGHGTADAEPSSGSSLAVEALAGEETPSARRALRPQVEFALLLAVVLVVVVAWAATTPAPEISDPAQWEVHPDMLIVSDDMGHELWRVGFPDGLREEPYATNDVFAPIIDDIDGDGLKEVIFAAYGEDRSLSSELIAFDSDGSVLWRHRPGLLISTATEAFDDIYRITSVRLLPVSDGTQDVIFSAHHHVFYPNVLTRLSSAGELRGRYWHAGQLGTGRARMQVVDLDNDGRAEILITGVNNARNAGTLVVLDPDRMDGVASETSREYQFQQFPPAQELARIFFPRSALTPPDDRYTVASTINPGRSTVTVSVQQALADTSRHVLYTFDSGLNLLGVSAGDGFVGRFRALRTEGEIEWPLDEELRRLEAIVVLRPAGPRGASAAAPATGDLNTR